MRPIGWIFRAAYRLRRHLWLGWSLARWLGLLLVAAVLIAVISAWPSPWPSLPLAASLLLYLVILAWAAQRGYLEFAPVPQPDALLQNANPALAPLRKEERVPVRASGWFSVQGRVQYYVDVDADFETVGTREHIVLGRIPPSRFLWLGRWPVEEVGWWYIFFQPTMIRSVTVGNSFHGPQPQPALRVVYGPDEANLQTIYLASENVPNLRRLHDDLLLDAVV